MYLASTVANMVKQVNRTDNKSRIGEYREQYNIVARVARQNRSPK